MDKTYTLFNLDGSIDGVISGTYEYMIKPTLAAWEGYSYEGSYDDSYYFHDGKPTKRPINPTTLNDSKLNNVPPTSIIRIDDESYECDKGGTVDLDFPMPGAYKITVESWPYLDKEFTYENNT